MKRLAVIVSVLAFAACAQAQSTVAERTREVASQVWSPYCPGRVLTECPTRQSQELRAEIADRLRSGQTTDEVLEWYAANYGTERLATPPSGVRGLTVWLVPAAAVLAGAVLLFGILRRRPGEVETAAEPPPVTEPTPDSIRRVRDEVQRDL